MYPGHTCPRYWVPSGFLRNTSLIDSRTQGKLIELLYYLTEGSPTARFPWCTDRTGLHTSITGTCGSTKLRLRTTSESLTRIAMAASTMGT